ncbi:glycogen synthase GlgA [Bacillus xiapuensis]|uniref:glycogen synthase GlgA n=1 Tax=Bacillus xiapuensis TaxID=2014075 RepID=UPI000C23A27A|nr:glycogen synthase GlgA [Bacillus xiapuensis]
MKLLFIVSECVPFVKSGGLADVAGSLPKELKQLGADIRVMLPKYGAIPFEYRAQMEKIAEYSVPVGWRNQYCGIEKLEKDGLIYYFIDNEYYFKRDGLYGHYDDGERFSFYTRAALDSLPHLDFFPDIIHCHDWHTGMIPFMLRVEHQNRPGYELIRTVFTIHNLLYQGIFPKAVLTDLLNLHDRYFNSRQLEFYGSINFMKGGLISADQITAVSPTYRNEILTPYYGEQLDGVLRERQDALAGILNGIDQATYDPSSDPLIIPYDDENLSGKIKNKLRLQEMFGLEKRADVPMMSIVSRLTKQKGLDLVKRVFHEMMEEDIQFIILGTGENEFEWFFKEMEWNYHQKFRAYIGFDEALAHQVYAASDLFLMPSKFEPCGLGQMIAMKYGALPIVRETGGLNDSVRSFNEHTEEGNGFSFTNFNAHDMLYTFRRAVKTYKAAENWRRITGQAMTCDYSWTHSASHYYHLYSDLTSRRESHVF